MTRHLLGETLVEFTPTAHGVVVGCPGCGAQRLFEPDEEPQLAHADVDCPVFRSILAVYRRFRDMSGSPTRWLA